MSSVKKATIGIMAPVDAGKTTLSEALLYNTGKLRKAGRVDHGDAFLDTEDLEKKRGITIYSKQAIFSIGDTEFTLVDTPGHMDFSAEMERTLQILDAAVLVISQADGITGYTDTLWKLLEKNDIPVIIFVNKMDQNGADRGSVFEATRKKLSEGAVDMDSLDAEEVAMMDERLLDAYLEGEEPSEDDITGLFLDRKLFPVVFGSALKMEGVDRLIEVLGKHAGYRYDSPDFGSVVFKITRDDKGNRLTHMKLLGGTISAKETIEELSEKVDRIRIYDGGKYAEVPEASAGSVVAVTGLEKTYCGQGLGNAEGMYFPEMVPALRYKVEFPEGTDMHDMFRKMKQLEEEDPQLQVSWDEEDQSINMCLMGKVQTEILHEVILERFGMDVTFGTGSIVYMETISSVSEGVGHYEPLKHYSEVHVLLEPLPRGEGLIFDCIADNDVLKPHWQRLILSHMMEKQHRGVLTGSFITDMKITLLTGKDHLKHTEPGDMRQSTYRAIRHGLMRNRSVLLEPVYSFRLTVPSENAGRAMTDIQRMHGRFDDPVTDGELTVLTGTGPVSTMNEYHSEVISYTKGRGSFYARLSGYEECHNADEVVESFGYDPEADLENQPGSIFCAHGAGFYVPWNEVESYMHLKPFDIDRYVKGEEAADTFERRNSSGVYDDELKAIFEKTYGKKKPHSKRWTPRQDKDRALAESAGHVNYDNYAAYSDRNREKYLIIDGYNCMFAWKESLSDVIPYAREEMIEMFRIFDAYTDRKIILVFDGYKAKGNIGSVEEYDGLTVVFTKEDQTADAYIEKLTAQLGRKADVIVASSDYMVQIMSFGAGAKRITAMELKAEVDEAQEKMRQKIKSYGREKNFELGRLLSAAMNKER